MAAPRWLSSAECDLDELASIVSETTDLDDYVTASKIEDRTLIYDATTVRATASADDRRRRELMAEVARALLDGPGIVVVRGAFERELVETASEAFFGIIDDERASGVGGGDHFARPGANDRVWNAFEKLAMRAPAVFVEYYANDILALVFEAWMGPGFQITSQINVVNPGGEAQRPHRDYHLGFMEDGRAEQYLSHIHTLSPLITLQGAIAHSDMPVETGPTMYLPHSQKYVPGYVAAKRQDFVDFFAEHRVQLPLMTGDVVFFNPGLSHAAGTNQTTDRRRIANLLQVTSPFARPIEHVDRRGIIENLYPLLRERYDRGEIAAVERTVRATADGYPFPCDLDVDIPVDRLVPTTDVERILEALGAGRSRPW